MTEDRRHNPERRIQSYGIGRRRCIRRRAYDNPDRRTGEISTSYSDSLPKHIDRRVSPAVGEFAIQECERLRQRIAALEAVIIECLSRMTCEWPDERDGPDNGPRTPRSIRMAKDLAREALNREGP